MRSRRRMAKNEWHIAATRAGRGEDHLVWRLRPLVRASGVTLGALDLAGPFRQKMLSRAGIETAITTADGGDPHGQRRLCRACGRR